ncbi:MAG: hypothetical protein JJD92_16690 [Frankiaceae bacterium]|nr:hypothetical protein [Frankiaceae bacterium]
MTSQDFGAYVEDPSPLQPRARADEPAGSAAGVDVKEVDQLRKLAQDKIVAETGKALDVIGEAAAALLADLYAAGLAHGITPDDWASVTALPGACWDVSRARARRQQTVVDKPFSERSWLTSPALGLGLHDEGFATPDPYRGPPTPQVRRGRSR